MADHPLIPAAPARTEIKVSNSRFIADALPADSVDAAKQAIAAIRAEMPDANHHCYAFVIGHGATTTLGMSDDGEPSGTAGRPILSVLKGSGLGDVVVVVTRYFGGTLLGTGGLVHAYGDAAKAVLALVEREEKIARSQVTITVDYASFEGVKRLMNTYSGVVANELFAADVQLEIVLPEAEVAGFSIAVRELTAGRATIQHE